jgi:outer membrane protein assembly factor BamB
MKILLLFSAILVSSTSAIFEDQAFKDDWRQKFVGSPEEATFFESPKSSKNFKDLVVVRSDSNVLGALDVDNGQIIWRQVFSSDEKLQDFKISGSKIVTSLSFNSAENETFVRSWNIHNGALIGENRLETKIKDQIIHQGFLFDGKPHLVCLSFSS